MGFFNDVGEAFGRFTGIDGQGRAGTTGTSLDYITPVAPIRMYQDHNQAQSNAFEGKKQAQVRPRQSAEIVSNIQGRQQRLAQDFQKNKDQYRGLLRDQAIKPLRMQMSQKLADTKLDSSRRGLLGSGIDQRNRADIVSQYKSDYGSALDSANNSFANLEADIMDAPVKTGLELGGAYGSAQEDYYRAALADMQGRNAALSGLGQGVGQGVGTYLANRNKGA